MNASSIERIEIEISQLALPDQLWLLERLIQRIRRCTLQAQPSLEGQLAAMAQDPHMKRELKAIRVGVPRALAFDQLNPLCLDRKR